MTVATLHTALIAPADTHALRQRVLRPHQDVADMVYLGDDDPRAVHAGVADAAGQPWRGIVSITPQAGAGLEGDDVWRLRGMAVDDGARGRGYGRVVMDFAVAEARARGARRFWCNARETAVRFYQRAGWSIVSDRFEIPGIGPHFVMVWQVSDGPR